MSIFYTYLYIDPSRQHALCPEGEPFYAGKGKGYRATGHMKAWRAGTKWVKPGSSLATFYQRLADLKQRGIEPIVKFTAKDLDEELAFLVEEEMISKFGRLDLGLGTLLNETDGGAGLKNPSARIRAQLSDARQHAEQSPDFKLRQQQAFLDANARPEVRKRKSTAAQERANRPELKQNLSKHASKTLVCPHCQAIGAALPMKRWHFDNCRQDVTHPR